MSNTILIKKSTTPNAVPTTGQLAMGELAINTYDGRLFTKIDTGTPSVFELTQNQPITVIGNVTGTSTNGVGNTTIDLTLSNTGVSAGTYGGTSGATTNVGVFTVDQYGRITSASNTAISTSSLANGNANIQVYNNGNITINPGGTANIAVFSTDGQYLTGLLSVTGNVISGNINTDGQVSAAGDISGNNLYGLGEASLTGNVIGGNINTAGVVSATGTITGGNLATAGTASATGNITGGNINTAGVVSSTGNVIGGNINTAGAVSATGNITSGNINTTGLMSSGTASVTGNAAVGNILTDGYFYANGAPVDFQQAAGSNTQIQFNDNNDFGASASFTFDSATNTLTVDTLTVTNQQISASAGNSVELFSDQYAQLNYNNTSYVWANTDGVYLETPGGTAEFNNNGNLSVPGDITGSNVVVTSLGDEQIAISSNGRLVGGIDLRWEFANASLWTTGIKSNGAISTSGTVVAFGNITGGNINTVGNVSANGVLTDHYYYANGAPVDFQQAAGTNTQIQFNSNNDFGASANFTFDSANNTLFLGGTANISGNATIDSVYISSSNISGGANSIQLFSTNFAQLNYNNESWVWVDSNGVHLETNGGTAVMSTTGDVYLPVNLEVGGNIANAASVTATGNVVGGNVNVDGKVVVPNIVSPSGELTIETASGNLNLYPASGNIVVNSYINGVLNPQQASDAATKQYVDDAVSSGITIHTPVWVESPDTAGSLNATYVDGGTTQTVTDITGNKTLTFGSSPALAVNDVIVFDTSSNGLIAGTAYFVYSTNGSNQVTLSNAYDGMEITSLTNGTGLAITSRANSGVGATLTNAGANAALTIDGELMIVGRRVLIYNQTNGYENGVYVVTTVGDGSTPWVLTRSSDTNTYGPKSTSQLDIGDYFFVKSGDTGAGESYVCTAPNGPIIFGTTSIEFTQFGASGVYTANTQAGLTLNGTVFSAKVDNDTTAFDGGGNIIVKAGANLVTPNIGSATGTSLSVTGNVTGGNINTGGLISVVGNVIGGNINTAGLVSATGNVTGGNINTAGLVSVLGNVIAGNIETVGLANVATVSVSNSVTILGNAVSTSTTTGALVVTGGLGVGGNIYGGAVYSGGDSVLTVNSTIDGGTY